MDNVKTVAISSAVRGLGYSSVWIYSSIYMTEFLKLSTFDAALVFMGGGLVASMAQYAGGSLGDKIGHRKVFISFLLAVFILSVLISSLGGINKSAVYYPIAFGSVMILNALQSPSSNALISNSSSIQLRGFSIMRVGNNMGWGIGPAIGGFLLSFFGFSSLFVFFAVTAFLSFVISIFVRNVNVKKDESILRFKTSNLALIILSIAALLVFMVQSQETISLSIYSNGIFSGQYYEIGIIYMLNGILVVLTQPFFYMVSRKAGEYFSLVVGILIYTVGFASYGLDSNLTQMLISTGIFTMGENLAFPTSYSIIASISRKNRIGTNIGIYNAFSSLGRSFGPLLGGYFLPIVSNHILFWIYVTFPGLLATVLLIIFSRTISRYRAKFSA
jgi:MFS family permease